MRRCPECSQKQCHWSCGEAATQGSKAGKKHYSSVDRKPNSKTFSGIKHGGTARRRLNKHD